MEQQAAFIAKTNPNCELKNKLMAEIGTMQKKLIRLENSGKLSKNQQRKMEEIRAHREDFFKSILYVKLSDVFDLEDIKQRLEKEQEKAESDAASYIGYEIKAIEEYIELREKISQLSSFREQGEDSLNEYSKNIETIISYIKSEHTTKGLCQQISSMLNNQKQNSDSVIDEFFANEESALRKILENKLFFEKNNDSKISGKGDNIKPITMSDIDRKSGRQLLFQFSGGAVSVPKMPDWKDWFDNALHSLKQTFSALKEKVTDLFRKKVDNPEGGDTTEQPSAPDNPDTYSLPETVERKKEKNTDNFYYMGEKGILQHIGVYQEAGKELGENLHISIGWFKMEEQELKQQEEPQKQRKQEDYER